MGVVIPGGGFSEDRASGALIVDGGLRFDSSKSHYLSRTPGSAGNRKTWTWAGWVKRSKITSGDYEFIFGYASGSTYEGLLWVVGSDKLEFWSSPTAPIIKTTQVFRDPSAWFHIVLACDTTQATSSNRVKLYVNGSQITQFDTADYPAQDFLFKINDTIAYNIGSEKPDYGRYFNGHLSNIHFIDGQALGPEYFGYTDPLTNTWRPKKYTGNFNYSPAAELFPSYTSLNWGFGTAEGGWAITNSDKTATYTGSGTYSDVFTTSLDSSTTYAFQLNVTVSESYGGWFFTDSTSISGTHPDERSGNSLGMRSSDSAAGTYGTFATANGTSDGQDQISNIPAPSNGSKTDFVINMSARKVWVKSSSSSTWIGGGDPSNSSSTASFLLPSGTIYFAFVSYNGTATITMDTLTSEETGVNSFYLPFDGSASIGQDQSGRGNNWTPVNFGGSNTIEKATGALPILNTDGGGKVARPGVFGSEENKYYTVTTANGSVYQFDITSGDNPSLSFIRGATYKFDYSSFTGHPLLFSSTNPDSSTTAYTDGTSIASNVISFTVPHDAPDTLYYYCQNHPTSMNGSISITTDTKKADPYAWKNVFALPLVGVKDDVSNQINSGSTAKTITVTNAVASSNASNFYGGSFYFDKTGDYINTSSSSDFTFGTSSFTIEGWFKYDSKDTYEPGFFQISDVASGSSTYDGTIYLGSNDANNRLYVNVGNDTTGYTPTGSFTAVNGEWHHIALVGDSGVSVRVYIDGIAQTLSGGSGSGSYNIDNAVYATIGKYYNNGNYEFGGYIQDFRIYKGVAKYTSNFIPASTDPDILPDSPSGVSYSSNLTQITDGAVSFDGTNDSLSIPDSADFTFGSGDFTMEAFVYCNNASTAAHKSIVMKYTTDNASSSWFWSVYNGGQYLYFYYGSSVVTIYSLSFPQSVWVHCAIVRDGNTLRMFQDGIQVATGDVTGLSNNDSSVALTIGEDGQNNYDMNGFISNARVIKGTALYTSNFTPPTEPLTSVENTKLLCCKSNSSATAFDVSPGSITANGNAAATNFNPFTVDIDAVRGKQSGYCTLNPLQNIANDTFSDGNLKVVTSSSNYGTFTSTMATPASGKWYAEVSVISQSGYCMLGLCSPYGSFTATKQIYNHDSVTYYAYDGSRWIDGSTAAYGATYTGGDLIGIAYDADNGTVTFYKNGVSQGVITGVPIREYCFAGSDLNGAASDTHIWNFGQKPFKFPPPAGFQPLTLANTPRPSIVRPDQYVGIVTYTGNGTTNTIAGLEFSPDLVWIKGRSVGYFHRLFDTVRPLNATIYTNTTNAEVTSTLNDNFTSFNSDGFTLGSTTSANGSNANNETFVAWCWKAGGNSNTFNIDDVGYDTAEAAGLTAGTITPTGASVNTKSKFSIITYTGNGSSSATVAHGLSQTPAMLILKARAGTNAINNWFIWHKGLSSGYNINFTTSAEQAGNFSSGRLGIPTDTTFGFTAGNDVLNVNEDETTYVVYAWAEIPGFSKFSSYTGNGNADGPVIITGFRPRLVVLKKADSDGDPGGWIMMDTARDSYNVTANQLFAQSSSEENGLGIAGKDDIDILSNGFKIRGDGGWINATGLKIIYMAWAEAPTFNLYGAQANAR